MPEINLSIESDVGDAQFSIGDRVTFTTDLEDVWLISGAKLEADKSGNLEWEYSVNKAFAKSYHEYVWFKREELRLV